MKMRSVLAAVCVCLGVACSAAGGAGQARKLYAPSYYIAIRAQREYEGAIRVRGASNLPPGAKIGLQVEELVPETGRKPLSTLMCQAVDQSGLFSAELQITKETYQKRGLIVDAIFLTNECSQDQKVLQVVGRHGEFLGNDAHHVTMDEVSNGMTLGMVQNPQLFQVSGWYFGVAAIAPVD